MDDLDDFGGYAVAIIGMANRFPGARTPEQFWDNLRDGVESVSQYSVDELKQRGVSARLLRNPSYVKAGCPLEGIRDFDPEFFGFSPKEAAILDPQHRQFYECCWEALERAGHAPSRFDGAVGVFAGSGMAAYFAMNLLNNPDLMESVGAFLLRHTGNDKDFLATRVSYCLDLKGPSINVQTACSTSAVAVHLACQSLLSEECDMALAGGVTIELPHQEGYLYKEGEILSPDGHCRAFDHRSKGTIFGSGAGVVVLRRLEDAIRDGDHIHSVVIGSAINNDGAGKVGYLAPSVDGQAAAVTEALEIAEVDADSIGYVECHGTGTPVGDPIEISALTGAFERTASRKGFCAIGSVKTNIGHLDTAAGVAGLIKATMAVEYAQLPPSLNYEAPNPSIDFGSTPFVVNDRLKSWDTKESRRRAAVNSLGVGGTNAFLIIEQAPEPKPVTPPKSPYQLLTFSAKNRKSLSAYANRLADFLERQPADVENQSLADVAYSLLEGREHMPVRQCLAVSDLAEAVQLLREPTDQLVHTASAPESTPGLVFMLPGGGVQYPRMAAGLLDSHAEFRQWMQRGCDYLKEKTGRDYHADLYGSFETDVDIQANNELLQKPSVQLPLIFLVEYALARQWIADGFEPDALIGHSMGENTAACLAGVMSFEDALGLVLLRGQLMDEVPTGGMLSVYLPAAQLQKYLSGRLTIAADNSPALSVASGPKSELEELAKTLAEHEIDCKPINIDIAAHSSLLDPILEPFGAYLRSIKLAAPNKKLISNLTGTWMTDQQATSPDYWVKHLRNTVKFAQGIETLLDAGEYAFLEVGPGSALGSLARQNPKVPASRVAASLRHPKEDTEDARYFELTKGKLWAAGYELAREHIWPGEVRRKVPLPTYAFNHRPFWVEAQPLVPEEQAIGGLERLEECDDWFSKPAWIQQGALATKSGKQSWLVFRDDGGIADRVASNLMTDGHDVTFVDEGDAYLQVDAAHYRLSPEAGLESYRALIEDLVASGRFPDRLLHTWLLTEEETFRPGSNFLHRNLEHGFYSLFSLARAMADNEQQDRSMHWLVYANGAQQVHAEALKYPEKSTALGACKAIPRELPNVTCSFFDVDLPLRSGAAKKRKSERTVEQLVVMISHETTVAPESGTFAYRENVRYQLQREALDIGGQSPPPGGESSLQKSGVYLITGGLGGIGNEIAKHLLRDYAAKIALVGRTPLPEESEWTAWLHQHGPDDSVSRSIRKIRELQGIGADVRYFAADVVDADRMRKVVLDIERDWGRICGVVHAAGKMGDSLIQMKSAADVEDVFAAKLHGTLVLDSIFADRVLDFFAVFSSTSTVVAPVGQIDYIAANDFLNAYAASRNAAGRRTLAINWGVWNQVGMAADAAAEMGFPSSNHSSPVVLNTNYPLFTSGFRRTHAGRERYEFEMQLSTKQWVVDQHRTKDGTAILPGTASLELIRAALNEVRLTQAFEVTELVFLQALVIPEDQAVASRVVFQETVGGFQFKLQSESTAGDRSVWQTHVEANVQVLRSSNPRTDATLDQICQQNVYEPPTSRTKSFIQTRQEAHLRFGANWQVLRKCSVGTREAIATLELSEDLSTQAASFQLHPGMLDIATGYAMDLIEGYALQDPPNSLWVPVLYGACRVYAPLPQRLHSWVRLSASQQSSPGVASFDVVLFDDDGNVCVEVTGLTIKELQGSVADGQEAMPGKLEAGTLNAGTLEPREDSGGDARFRQLSPAELAFQDMLALGILPEEGVRAFVAAVETVSTPSVYVSSLPLDELTKETEAAARKLHERDEGQTFERPDLDTDYVEPTDDIQRTLVKFWRELLGVERIGVKDSFFDLGGHSLIAVRLFAKIQQTFHVDFPISILFEAPTIEGCADLIREAAGDNAGDYSGDYSSEAEEGGTREDSKERNQTRRVRFSYLVPMHSTKSDKLSPFFLVAGMFGNVLNLRHLAQSIGNQRPFYGLQARGLFGDAEPHETFEKMAKDYIAEMLEVQPQGPYLVGGFSGGGITAYEIARQLLEAGHEVSKLVFLDTPLPYNDPLSSVDRMSIHWQRLKVKGFDYFREWAENRYNWELQRFRKRFGFDEPVPDDPAAFKSGEMEVAFYQALKRYRIQPLAVSATLFRPPLPVEYHLSGGRVAREDRQIVMPDNGWPRYIEDLTVHEVPGDHDSMVLEPNVRILATKLRQCLDDAEGAWRRSDLHAVEAADV